MMQRPYPWKGGCCPTENTLVYIEHEVVNKKCNEKRKEDHNRRLLMIRKCLTNKIVESSKKDYTITINGQENVKCKYYDDIEEIIKKSKIYATLDKKCRNNNEYIAIISDKRGIASNCTNGNINAKLNVYNKSVHKDGFGTINIGLRTLTGKEILFESVNLEKTTYEFKGEVYKREGIPEDQQRLIYEGKQFEDEEPLFAYFDEHVGKEMPSNQKVIMYLVLRLRGGMFCVENGVYDYEKIENSNNEDKFIDEMIQNMSDYDMKHMLELREYINYLINITNNNSLINYMERLYI